MSWTVVKSWDENNRVAKYKDFATKAEAEQHVEDTSDEWPGAFAIETPVNALAEYVADPDAKTIMHSPTPKEPPTVIDTPDFIDRFADSELTAVRDAAAGNIALWRWVQKATGTNGTINLESENTIAGMQSLVDAGVISSARRNEILTPGI